MLHQLAQYASRKNLAAEPGFAPKSVRWAIACGEGGAYEGIQPLGESEGKRNPGREFPCCPELTQPEMVAGGEKKSHFLADSAEVVALMGDKAATPATQEKHAYFVRLLKEASEAMPDLALFARLLDDPAMLEKVRADLAEHKAKPTDKVTLAMPNHDPVFLVESTQWHDWWRKFRASLAAGDETQKSGAGMVCLLSGEMAQPVKTHPKIMGLASVGGRGTGDALVSFDKESFCSYGFEQSANAATSPQSAAAYRAGLNDLIANHSHTVAGVKIVHWYKGKDDVASKDDIMDRIFDPDPDLDELDAQQRAAQLLRAWDAAKRPDLKDCRYYSLTLSGAAGRVMVRDWMEGKFEDLAASVERWFDDLSIADRAGGGLAPRPKFLAVLAATVRDLNDAPQPLAASLWRAAIDKDAPIPAPAHAGALARVKVDMIQNNTPSHARFGLLKAYHVRKGDTQMQPFLNESHPAPAYHCGRLMAVLAAVQYKALGDVGAGLVQRFYAAASATPALVLGRLTRSSQFHLDKLEPGLARFFGDKIASIWAAMQKDPPRTLTAEEQSLFAMGYYHQMASDRQRMAESAKAGGAPAETPAATKQQ